MSAWGKERIAQADYRRSLVVTMASGRVVPVQNKEEERMSNAERMRNMIGPSSRWERLEAWLFDKDTDENPVENLRFTNVDLGAWMGVDRREASAMITAYLDAQRSVRSNTLYVLHRTGRTSTAVWQVGQRTADAREIGGTLFEDVQKKVTRAFEPDLRRLAEKNPRAARFVSAKIGAVIDGALVTLAAATDSFLAEDED